MELFLEADGALRLVTTVADVGVGAHTMHQQVAAEILGVEPELVGIDVKGTDGPYDQGVRASRGANIEGQAVAQAAVSLVDALRHEAAGYWNVEVERVRWDDGRATLIESEEQLDLKELARVSRKMPLRGAGHHRAARGDIYDFQAVVADVAVDLETGKVKVQQISYTHDATKVINPLTHDGQIQGAIAQGIGHTLMENLAVEDGIVQTLHLGDYKIPTIQDLPPLTITDTKAQEGPGPFGIKAVSEMGIGIAAPAIANAVYNATGVRIQDLPITAEKVLNGLRDLGRG